MRRHEQVRVRVACSFHSLSQSGCRETRLDRLSGSVRSGVGMVVGGGGVVCGNDADGLAVPVGRSALVLPFGRANWRLTLRGLTLRGVLGTSVPGFGGLTFVAGGFSSVSTTERVGGTAAAVRCMSRSMPNFGNGV